jgi:hypothetical protein
MQARQANISFKWKARLISKKAEKQCSLNHTRLTRRGEMFFKKFSYVQSIIYLQSHLECCTKGRIREHHPHSKTPNSAA